MNSRIAAFDRVVVLLTGLLILLGGLWVFGLYIDLPLAQRIADALDPPAWRQISGSAWLDPVLAGIAVVTASVGGWLIALNVRSWRVSRVTSPASDETGTIEVNLATLASAVAADLGEHPRVESVTWSVVESWDRPTMTVTVRARAGADIRALIGTLEKTERAVRQALPGIDLDTVFALHLLPVRP